MEMNIGNADRIIRAAAGILLSWWGANGAVLTGTSLISVSPL